MEPYQFLAVLIITLFSCCCCNASLDSRNNNIRRLSGNLKPDFYTIRIHPFFDAPGVTFDPERNQTFDGDVTIFANVLHPTTTIILNAMNLTFPCANKNVIFSNTEMKAIKIINFLITPENQTITIDLERQLQQNESITIKLKYIGQIGDNTQFGLFKSTPDKEWATEDEYDDVVYVTQFETTGARYVFPSFDEPDYKATFQVTIVKPKQWVALSNTFNFTITDIGNGYEEVFFINTEIISTYLVAFGIGDLISVTGYTADYIVTRIWSTRSGKDLMAAALESAIKCTDAITKYTNFTLPLLKIDHLAVPWFGGAMENFGLIVYGRNLLLFNPKVEKLRQWLQRTSIICHELSHHWFGDMVTNKWWGDIFIHEGFADFFQNKAMALAYPKEKEYMDLEFAQDNVEEFIWNDKDVNYSHPIITKNGSFDAITYQMGGAVIRQLEAVITPEVLQKGLQKYIKKYRFSNAIYQQLLDEIQSSVDETKLKDWCGESFNVTSFLKLWLNQKGHPHLNVDFLNGTFFITQHVQNGTDEKLWPLPIFVQLTNNQKRLFWSAPKYACKNGKILPKILKIKTSALFINRDVLAVTKAYYSKSAIEAIVDALTSFTTNLQLSPASLYLFSNDIFSSAEIDASKEHLMKIVENIFMYQRKVFSYGIFEVFTDLIEKWLESGKFNNVIEHLQQSNNRIL